jgi:hypothetical protein
VNESPRRWTTNAGLKADTVEEETRKAARAVIRMIRVEKAVCCHEKEMGQDIVVCD